LKTTFGLDSYKVERRAIRDGESVVLSLGFPPSVNNMFVNMPGHGRVLSKQYREWRAENGWRIMAARAPRIPGPVKVTYEYENRVRRADLTNFVKAPEDLLVSLNIIDGDHNAVVREVVLRWADIKGCRVTIEPYREPDSAPTQARRAA
jgi:hypothetical protein